MPGISRSNTSPGHAIAFALAHFSASSTVGKHWRRDSPAPRPQPVDRQDRRNQRGRECQKQHGEQERNYSAAELAQSREERLQACCERPQLGCPRWRE